MLSVRALPAGAVTERQPAASVVVCCVVVAFFELPQAARARMTNSRGVM